MFSWPCCISHTCNVTIRHLYSKNSLCLELVVVLFLKQRVSDPPTRAEKKKRITETQRIESGKRPRNWNDSEDPLFHQRLAFVVSSLYYFSSD
jgi:hypothetical protein